MAFAKKLPIICADLPDGVEGTQMARDQTMATALRDVAETTGAAVLTAESSHVRRYTDIPSLLKQI